MAETTKWAIPQVVYIHWAQCYPLGGVTWNHCVRRNMSPLSTLKESRLAHIRLAAASQRTAGYLQLIDL